MTARSTYKVCKVVLKQSDPMITVLFNIKYILNETKLLENMQAHKDNSLGCCHLSFIGSMTIKIFGLLLIILSLIFWRKKFIQENFTSFELILNIDIFFNLDFKKSRDFDETNYSLYFLRFCIIHFFSLTK